MDRKTATSYDVARLAGVSQSAVSRAFSPGASIAKATRDRVLVAAEELGYQPNAIARSMSSARNEPQQKSGMVGLIVTRMQDPFFAHTVAGLSRTIQARGWQILLFTVESQDEVDAALETLMRFKIDGVLILSAILSERMADSCRAAGIPVILYNRSSGDLGVTSVQVENREGGRVAADFLLEVGHERIAFLAGDDSDTTSRQREEGFVNRLGEAGRTLFLREAGDYTFASGREAGLRLFSRQERPDAVFCASDVMALGVLHAARHELGLEPPRDFSLIGFDDIPAADWPGHQLTTIRQPINRMIHAAVEALVGMMENPEQPAQTQRFPGTLILRASCRLRTEAA
ncbi:MAG: LacI family DNA-binding transcriptional regulator [Paracoccaceae bacterium]